MKPNWVWVVEIQPDRRGEYVPTVGCALHRAEGRKRLANWKAGNPDDGFRLRLYVRWDNP